MNNHIGTFTIDDFREYWINTIVDYDELNHKDRNIARERLIDIAEMARMEGLRVKITLEREYG